MIAFRHSSSGFLVVVFAISVLHNVSSSPAVPPTAADADSNDDISGDESGGTPAPTQPSANDAAAGARTPGAGGARAAEKKLTAGDAIGRLRQTNGRTLSAAKRVVDESVQKLRSTADGIRRAVSGDDRDDTGGDRRISDALDAMFRSFESESKAAFEYASHVINETADRAKEAVDRAGRPHKSRRR